MKTSAVDSAADTGAPPSRNVNVFSPFPGLIGFVEAGAENGDSKEFTLLLSVTIGLLAVVSVAVYEWSR